MSEQSSMPVWHGTTILSVRRGGKVVVAGDGQLSMGQTVMKPNARKVRTLGPEGKVIGGFAGGAVARALPLTTCLWLGAIVQGLSNLVFVWLATAGTNTWALSAAITAENFAGAIGTVIFGIMVLGEPASAVRLLCVALIVAGIAGLKLTTV